MVPKTPNALLHGTLDALILKTLAGTPRHGYAIARWTQQLTGDAFKLGQGSLYPALYRLEERGWIESEWRLSDTNRRTKVYRLTPVGRAQLKAETAGVVRSIHVENAQPVEYGELLFELEPVLTPPAV